MTVIAQSMSEGALTDAIVELAHLLGFAVAHFRPGRTAGGYRTAVAYDGAGFFDLVLIGPRGVIFAEVKAEHGAVRADQKAWLQRAANAGARVFVWRPSHWVSGEIERELRS